MLLGLHHPTSVHLPPTFLVVVNAGVLLWQPMQDTEHVVWWATDGEIGEEKRWI